MESNQGRPGNLRPTDPYISLSLNYIMAQCSRITVASSGRGPQASTYDPISSSFTGAGMESKDQGAIKAFHREARESLDRHLFSHGCRGRHACALPLDEAQDGVSARGWLSFWIASAMPIRTSTVQLAIGRGSHECGCRRLRLQGALRSQIRRLLIQGYVRHASQNSRTLFVVVGGIHSASFLFLRARMCLTHGLCHMASSFWKVGDAVTTIWMERLYRGRGQHQMCQHQHHGSHFRAPCAA